MKRISRRARPHTVTLYNYLGTAGGAALYQRTVLRRVYLDTAYQQRLAKIGVTTQDSAQLIIDLRDLSATDDRTFKPSHDWMRLPVEQRGPYFTFFTQNDFFVSGEIADTSPPATKQDMIQRYQCLSVSGVSASLVPSGGIVEVTGR